MNNINTDSLLRLNKNLIKSNEYILNPTPLHYKSLYTKARISHIHNDLLDGKSVVLGTHKGKTMKKVNTIHVDGKSRGVWTILKVA